MSKENIKLIINAVLMILIGVVVAVQINAHVLREPKDLLFGEKITLDRKVNIEDASGSSYSIIDYKQLAKDADGKTIATVYTVKIRNGFAFSDSDKSYGYIELLVGIKDNEVYVQIVELAQTKAYNPKIQRYIYENFEGAGQSDLLRVPYFNAVPDADLESGATASTSTESIKALIIRTWEFHNGIVSDPYEEVFGAGYSIVADTTFTASGLVSAKDTIFDASSAEVATRYTAATTNEHGSVEVAVSVNASGEIVYAEFTVLDQTAGLSTSRSNLELYIGTMLSDVTPSGDLAGGATHTSDSMEELLQAIAVVWEGEN